MALTGDQRRKLLKKAVKRGPKDASNADLAWNLLDIYNEAKDNAGTTLTDNLVTAIDAIGNARFPKAWAEVKADY